MKSKEETQGQESESKEEEKLFPYATGWSAIFTTAKDQTSDIEETKQNIVVLHDASFSAPWFNSDSTNLVSVFNAALGSGYHSDLIRVCIKEMRSLAEIMVKIGFEMDIQKLDQNVQKALRTLRDFSKCRGRIHDGGGIFCACQTPKDEKQVNYIRKLWLENVPSARFFWKFLLRKKLLSKAVLDQRTVMLKFFYITPHKYWMWRLRLSEEASFNPDQSGAVTDNDIEMRSEITEKEALDIILKIATTVDDPEMTDGGGNQK